MTAILTLIAIGILIAAFIILVLPHRYNPIGKPKQLPPEDEGIDRDTLAVNRGHCPNCRAKDSLLAGPGGGMAQNVMCHHCLHEFNVMFGFGTGAFKVDRSGVASESRAAVFGIQSDEYRQIEGKR